MHQLGFTLYSVRKSWEYTQNRRQQPQLHIRESDMIWVRNDSCVPKKKQMKRWGFLSSGTGAVWAVPALVCDKYPCCVLNVSGWSWPSPLRDMAMPPKSSAMAPPPPPQPDHDPLDDDVARYKHLKHYLKAFDSNFEQRHGRKASGTDVPEQMREARRQYEHLKRVLQSKARAQMN